MEIKLLKRLSAHPEQSIFQLSKFLKIDSIEILKNIAKINQLQSELIQNSNGKYSLSKNLDWLDSKIIQKDLQQQELDYKIILLPRTESTNNYALNNINQIKHQTLISTDWQYAGRGKFGRTWLSDVAQDITISLVYIFPADYNLSLLPLICAVAINRLLKTHSTQNQIKWPNDIYVDKTKVAGVLVENLVRNQQNHTVIGIGLDNIGLWSRNKIIAAIVANLHNLIQEFELFGFEFLRREWLDNCLHLNKIVLVTQSGQILAEGTHCDISESGELIVNSHSGKKIFSSSAISLIVKDF